MENETKYLADELNRVENTLTKTPQKQILLQSFFNLYGEPLEFFKPILEREKNLTKTFMTMFPYAVAYSFYCHKEKVMDLICAEDIWMIFHSHILFRNQKDAIICETILKLYK